jgi:hypothetical protein
LQTIINVKSDEDHENSENTTDMSAHELLSALLVSGNLYTVMREALKPSQPQPEKLAVLEFIWKMIDSNTPSCINFLRDGMLVWV